MSASRLVNISDVLTQLQGEFPELTTSKIRFLEAKGLLTPTRTDAGYRKYTGADVERLRTVLTLQRDQYLPLTAIADRLDAMDRGLGEPEKPQVADPEDGMPPLRRARLRRSELVAQAGVAPKVVTDLESFGIVAADGQGFYGAEQVDVVRVAASLAEFGVEARHLRAFVSTAEREIGLIERVVLPMRSAGRRDEADTAAAELAALCLRLHTGLFRASLTTAGL